ncbi:BT_3987 domain-containing protein [Bacteroides xylanisolvens]|uniref:BT_3987 domain-containing protein n=1 Tax=Bacteroides xylanisolvens TaxID=371601 RepID=UPI0018973355|nr:DUF1735 domain-containing protein [Bacteroides xylanisolvens]
MKRILKYIWLWGLLSLCVSSCEEEAAVINPDVSHDKPTEVVIGDSPRLCSDLQKDNQQVFLIVTDKENEVVTDQVSVVLKEAATGTKNLTVVVDKDFDVEAFQLAYTNSNYTLLPDNAYELGNGGSLTIAAGAMQSGKMTLILKGWMLPVPENFNLGASQYLLPLKIKEDGKYQTLLYRINWTNGKHRLTSDKGYTCIGYVDTEKMSPLVSSVYWLQENYMDKKNKCSQLFDVVNLLRATIDAGGKLNLNADISHVLKNADKYIRPLQLMGMKVCLTVKNSSTIGFCHLTDGEIDNLVAQVKTAVELYGLDGIDLWDDSDEYGANGIKNTSAYPKLIKALRGALSKETMLTVADKGEATASFFDKEKCGGIEVGKYIDYAYNGYVNQYSIPFWTDFEVPEAEWMICGRKPFAGLEKNRFVCFTQDFTQSLLATYDESEAYLNFIMDMEGTGSFPGFIVFNESKGYIAYDLRDNMRGMENLLRAPMDDMQPLYDPNFETQVFTNSRQAGAVGNDVNNTYFRKDW